MVLFFGMLWFMVSVLRITLLAAFYAVKVAWWTLRITARFILWIDKRASGFGAEYQRQLARLSRTKPGNARPHGVKP